MELVLTRNFGEKGAANIENYISLGGYNSLKKLFLMKPGEVTEEVVKSGLRGRGGAGFPTGKKWQFVPKSTDKPVYLCVNADESEPGTFKDRAIIENDPHRIIEGTIIAAYAIGARKAFVYFRGEFAKPHKIFENAVSEAYKKGFLGKNILGRGFDLDVLLHRGAGAYICGEETALLSSIEGDRGYPKIRPPFPAVKGLWGYPTIINNIETIASLPFIIERGSEAYAAIGRGKSRGTKLFSVSGHVTRPGVYEVPLGIPFVEFLHEYAGGVWKGRSLKALIVGGSSVPVLKGEETEDLLLDYESCQEKGTMLGSGGMIVMDDRTCMVWVLARLAKFYHHESCGQCTPCREGSGWIYKILKRILEGRGEKDDIGLLLELADNMMGKTICVLADALAMPVKSFVEKFREEFEEHILTGSCKLCLGSQ